MRTITRLLSARARSRVAFELPPIENEYSIFFLISLELNIGSLWLTREFLTEREYERMELCAKFCFQKKRKGLKICQICIIDKCAIESWEYMCAAVKARIITNKIINQLSVWNLKYARSNKVRYIQFHHN